MNKKVLIIKFGHETNAFCPAPADMQAFRNYCLFTGAEIFPQFRGRGSEMGAFLDALEPRTDIELIPTVAMFATPSGPVTKEVYDFVISEVTRVIEDRSPIDAVILACHGAMVVEGRDDGEGDLYEMIRNLVGDEIPLMSSLDLHANVTEKMVRNATALIPFEYYPHIDDYETGFAVAKLMEQTLDKVVQPVMSYRRIPYLLPLFPTAFPEMKPLYRIAKDLEKRPGVLHVKITHGFYAADIEEMGMAVLAITDGDRALAEAIAEEMKSAIEEQIPCLKRTYPTLDEALDRALIPGEGPVVLGDASDNPGAGGLGDTTHILRRILERGITGAVVATILDPVSAEICHKEGAGSNLHLSLGGRSDPAFSGGPVEVDARVIKLSDGKYRNKGQMKHGMEVNHGMTALVEIAGNMVYITSLPTQPFDLEIFRSHGIDPAKQKILVTKSAIHYMADYGTVAREMISLSLPGYSVPVPEHYTFRNWKG